MNLSKKYNSRTQMAALLLSTGLIAAACSTAGAIESNSAVADSSSADAITAIVESPEAVAVAEGASLSFAQVDAPVAQAEVPVTGFPIDLAFVGLEPLGADFVYEGWVVVDGTPVSTGRFTIAENDGARTYTAPNLATASDLESATDFVLTIEPAVGDDPAPAAAKPLGGQIVDGVAQLSHAHPAALGNDFSTAGGQFIIATPTTANDATDDTSGVWFIDVSSGSPEAGLDLPALPAGWVYEGWAVIDGTPVSTGRFTDATMPDDFGGFSGLDPNPPFPGEDFIQNAPAGLTFPTDLTAGDGATVVLSIEPADDDSPAPFAFKPLALNVAGATVGQANVLGAGPGFPSGTASLNIPAAPTGDGAVDNGAVDNGAAPDAVAPMLAIAG